MTQKVFIFLVNAKTVFKNAPFWDKLFKTIWWIYPLKHSKNMIHYFIDKQEKQKS